MVQAVIPTTVVGLQGRAVAATPAPTNNQALIWNGTAWVPGGPYLTAAGAPYVTTNYVDNSGFVINQRAYGSGTALAAGAYGFDRWKAGASGCTLTFTNSPASTVVTVTAGTLQQVVEGAVLMNSSYTLSWTGSATGRVNTGTYVASPITFTGAPNTNITIEFQGGTLGQVLLQLGTQVTLWQPQPLAVELERCQRLYFSVPLQLAVGSYSAVIQGFWFPVLFPTQMRVAPTMTIVHNGDTNVGVVQSNNANISGFSIYVTTAAAGPWSTNVNFTASADL